MSDAKDLGVGSGATQSGGERPAVAKSRVLTLTREVRTRRLAEFSEMVDALVEFAEHDGEAHPGQRDHHTSKLKGQIKQRYREALEGEP